MEIHGYVFVRVRCVHLQAHWNMRYALYAERLYKNIFSVTDFRRYSSCYTAWCIAYVIHRSNTTRLVQKREREKKYIHTNIQTNAYERTKKMLCCNINQSYEIRCIKETLLIHIYNRQYTAGGSSGDDDNGNARTKNVTLVRSCVRLVSRIFLYIRIYHVCVCLCLLQSTHKFGATSTHSPYKHIDMSTISLLLPWLWPCHYHNYLNVLIYGVCVCESVFFSSTNRVSVYVCVYGFFSLHFFWAEKHLCTYRSVVAVNALCVFYSLSFVFHLPFSLCVLTLSHHLSHTYQHTRTHTFNTQNILALFLLSICFVLSHFIQARLNVSDMVVRDI